MSHLHLLTHADVFAPEPLGLRSVLVAGGRILWIGAAEPPQSPGWPVTRYDLEGRALIPGLIDGHAHVTGGGGESGFDSRIAPLTLGRFTCAGITSAVGVLGTDDTTRTTRGLVAATLGLRAAGLSAWCHTGGYHLPPTTLTGSVRDDIVFLDPVIGAGEIAICDHRSSHPAVAELIRLASDCHVAGLITGKAGILHLHLGDGAAGLEPIRAALAASELPPRVFNPTHVNRRKALFDEALALASAGCNVDVTAFPVADGEDAYSAADAVVRFLDSGAPPERLTVSSDGGGCLPRFDADGRLVHMDIGRPGALHDTLVALVGRGVPLARALPPLTRHVAALLRLSAKGRIAVGADADLVVLDADLSVRDVMARGRWHVRQGRQLVFGQVEPPAPAPEPQ
jgi:beta-aspartyl-dipeptidase (metallo-type)